MWIVKLALSRPYTFVVLALVLILISPVILLRTPVDIFPNINIPVISVIWTYSGLAPAEMGTRIVSIFERSLTTSVNNIEHIESQSLNGVAVVKVFLQPSANIDGAISEVIAEAQVGLKQFPAWHHASAGHQLQRLFRAHLATGTKRKGSLRAAIERSGFELYSPAARHHSRGLRSDPLRRESAANYGGHRLAEAPLEGTLTDGRRKRGECAERRAALRDCQDRQHRIQRRPEREPADRRRIKRSCR